MSGYINPWEEPGEPVSVSAPETQVFVSQHVAPLFYRDTEPAPPVPDSVISDEKDFWTRAGLKMLSVIHLSDVILTDFFPRAPGVYWSPGAKEARDSAYLVPQGHDPELGEYKLPAIKLALVENGGLGTIRLRPKAVNGKCYWFATAVKHASCDAGIPLAIPEEMLITQGMPWGHSVSITGRLHFLQDAGLENVGDAVHGTRPLILFVEELRDPTLPGTLEKSVKVRPTILFERPGPGELHQLGPGYIYVTCNSIDTELKDAADWMARYAAKFSGKILTNFDEQMPRLADAPLSYQRLVTRTHDRQVINLYGGELIAERVETLTYDYSATYHGDVHMGDTITANSNATVINRSTITNSTVTINASPSLSPEQKLQLTALVEGLRSELEPVQATYPAEAKRMDRAIEDAVAEATKQVAERKKPFLDLTATSLLQTAKLLVDVAPGVVHAAGKLATYLQGLV
jgi:hypothetical protein